MASIANPINNVPNPNPVTTAPGSSTSQAGGQTGAASSDSGTSQIANKETFLKLLVAQMKNQDPLNPTDGTQFVSQLAQFSELEQVIGIRADADGLLQNSNKAASQAAGQGASPAGGQPTPPAPAGVPGQ